MRNHFSALLDKHEVELNENRVDALMSLTSCLVTEVCMAGYWESRSTSSRNALFAVGIQFITSLCLQYERYSAFIISVTRGRRWRQRYRKTRFLFGSSSSYGIKCSMLFTGNQSFPRNSCRSVHHIDYSSMPQASNKPRFHLHPLFRNPFNLKPPPFSQEHFCLFITNCLLLLCNLSVKER